MAKPLSQHEQLNALIGATVAAGWKAPTTAENNIVSFYPPDAAPIAYNPVRTNNGRGIRQLARQLQHHGIDTDTALDPQRAVRIPAGVEAMLPAGEQYGMVNFGARETRQMLAKLIYNEQYNNEAEGSGYVFAAAEMVLGFVASHTDCHGGDVDKALDDLAREHEDKIAEINAQHRDELVKIHDEVTKLREAIALEQTEAKKKYDALIKEFNKREDVLVACRAAFADEPAWKLLATIGTLLGVET